MTAPSATVASTHKSSLLDRFPPAAMVLLAVLGFQLGAVIAKPAIEDAGVIHTSFVRSLLSALMLLAWIRPSFPHSRPTLYLVLGSGALIAANTLLMYAAIERIPIGIAVAIGFWGPMVIALHGSHRPIDYAWVGLAILGILLFTPLTDASFDSLGVLLAILAGACFGVTLMVSSALSRRVGGVQAAGLAMTVATLLIAPFSIGQGLSDVITADFVTRMTVTAFLIGVIGFGFEYTALTRIKPSLYAILICLEPAAGAILGYLILGEQIGWLGAAGIGAVTAASIGASLTRPSAHA